MNTVVTVVIGDDEGDETCVVILDISHFFQINIHLILLNLGMYFFWAINDMYFLKYMREYDGKDNYSSNPSYCTFSFVLIFRVL